MQQKVRIMQSPETSLSSGHQCIDAVPVQVNRTQSRSYPSNMSSSTRQKSRSNDGATNVWKATRNTSSPSGGGKSRSSNSSGGGSGRRR